MDGTVNSRGHWAAVLWPWGARGRGNPHHEFGGVLEGHTTRTTEWGSPVDRGCSALSERALRCMCWRPVGHVYLLSVRVNTYHITDRHFLRKYFSKSLSFGLCVFGGRQVGSVVV